MFLRRLNCLFWGHTWFPTVLEHRNVWKIDPEKSGLIGMFDRLDRNAYQWHYCTCCGASMPLYVETIEYNMDPLHEAGGRLPNPKFHPLPGDW
jgi:hypothetical protein